MNKCNNLLFPKLSYIIVGICFAVHNELGRYSKEKRYANLLEQKLKEANIPYKRELSIASSGNVIDFLIDDKIILEIKAKRVIIKDDYIQLQRYLQETKIRLGILINFRNRYLKPTRIIRIDTVNRNKY